MLKGYLCKDQTLKRSFRVTQPTSCYHRISYNACLGTRVFLAAAKNRFGIKEEGHWTMHSGRWNIMTVISTALCLYLHLSLDFVHIKHLFCLHSFKKILHQCYSLRFHPLICIYIRAPTHADSFSMCHWCTRHGFSFIGFKQVWFC